MTSARSPGSGPPPPPADVDAVGVVVDDVTLGSELSSPALLAPASTKTTSVVTLNCHCLFKQLLENQLDDIQSYHAVSPTLCLMNQE